MKKTTSMAMAAFLITALVATARASDPIASDPDRCEFARQLFDHFVALERAYSPDLSLLFAPSARVESRTVAANGDVKTLRIPGPAHRDSLRFASALAEARADRGTYSNVTYTSEGSQVRITALRVAEGTRQESEVSLLVGPDSSNRWVVWEQISEANP